MAITDAVVPVAGLGTRLLPATKSQPKEMLPVGAKPVVQYVVEELRACGVDRVLFVTGRGKSAIEDHFDDDPELIRALREAGREELLAELEFERMGVEFAYTRQRRQRGLGDAILYAERFSGSGPFIVALGDAIIGRHEPSPIVARLTAAFEASGAACAIAVQAVPRELAPRYGMVAGEPDGHHLRVTGLVEKPAPADAPGDLAVAARYVFSPAIFGALRATPPGHGGEVQLTDAIRRLLDAGEHVVAVTLGPEDRRYDVGTVESYCATFLEFALTDPRYGERLRERAAALLR